MASSSGYKNNILLDEEELGKRVFKIDLSYRVTGTMLARSSSVRVIARSTPSQFSPLLKHTCGELASHHASHQKVGRCSTRCGS